MCLDEVTVACTGFAPQWPVRQHSVCFVPLILAVCLYPPTAGTRDRLRAACVEYLQMGGPCTAGPIGLLAGLTPRPSVLVSHFFAVAMHAMRRSLLPIPTPAKLRQGYDLLHIACMIIMPLVAMENATILSSKPILALVNVLFPWRNVDPATMQ